VRTLIRGGTVVTATGTLSADVLVDGETVAALLAPAHTGALAGQVDRTLDAAGQYVMPGGIDVHTHLEMPFGGTFSADDFETGTRAAAWGGTTTIVDFAVQKKGSSLQETLDTWHGKASGKASIDYGFHMIVSDVNARTLKEMDVLVGEGVTSFKMFMAYPGVFYATDGEILQAMQKAAGNGATIMMHAENGIAIDALVAQALEAGHTDPGWHGRTRPPELEGEATSRAIRLAQVAGAPLYIVHLSARHALDAVTEARDRGLPAGPHQGSLEAHVARAAHERPVRGVHRPLPVLLQGAEGARPRRLLQDPERHPGHRAPDRPAAPGGRRRAAALGPLG